MEDKYLVSFWPHISRAETTPRIIWTVAGSLVPAGIVGVVIFGLHSLWIILVSVGSCLILEALIQYLRKVEVTILDGSAVLTGLLLAYNLPPGVPLWMPLVGALVAVGVAKQAFGGLGRNIFNPALVGRAFLMAAWPKYMTTFSKPFSYDAVSAATPLAVVKDSGLNKLADNLPGLGEFFIGNRGGCIGEVCILALLFAAAYLLFKGYISWEIPFSFIFTVGAFSWIFGFSGQFSADVIFYILSGGLILGAFFMATDYVTTPLTRKGQLIFGFGCGLITFIIRRWGGYPEGVSYSILLMNAFTPLIDRYIRPRRYGLKKGTGNFFETSRK